MVEFTSREQKIIHAMTVFLNPEFKEVPFDLKRTLVQGQLLIRNIPWNEDEMTDIMNGISAETKMTIKNGLAFLYKHKDTLKGLKKL